MSPHRDPVLYMAMRTQLTQAAGKPHHTLPIPPTMLPVPWIVCTVPRSLSTPSAGCIARGRSRSTRLTTPWGLQEVPQKPCLKLRSVALVFSAAATLEGGLLIEVAVLDTWHLM